jgi:hypothetical protein
VFLKLLYLQSEEAASSAASGLQNFLAFKLVFLATSSSAFFVHVFDEFAQAVSFFAPIRAFFVFIFEFF